MNGEEPRFQSWLIIWLISFLVFMVFGFIMARTLERIATALEAMAQIP